MNRVLLIGSAHPRRVRRKAEQLLAGAEAGLTILCAADPEIAGYLQTLPGVAVIAFDPARRPAILEELRRQRFDAVHVFWSGEGRHRRLKLAAMRLGAPLILVDAGDGCSFQITWRAVLRFALFRWKHPLPSDHNEYFPPPALMDAPPPAAPAGETVPPPGERILVVQSAEPPYVLRALSHLRQNPIFADPRYTLFCRNRPEILRQFSGHPLLREIRTHDESRGSWQHLKSLRRERFDAEILFLTGDPSYRKIKCFALMLGARHTLVFNENSDCFYLSWRSWFSLLAHRLKERSSMPVQSHHQLQARAALLAAVKLLLLPFRFVWLLAVWLWLRAAAWRASG